MVRTKRYQDLIESLKEHGYNSQADLAKALVQTEYYKDKKVPSIRAYVNQVLRGKSTLSKNLERALLEVCSGDRRVIDRLRGVNVQSNQSSSSKQVEQALELKLGEIYELFRDKFLKLDWKGRADMCSDFETFVQGYLAERTPAEKKE